MCFCSGAVATNQGCIHYFFSIGYVIYIYMACMACLGVLSSTISYLSCLLQTSSFLYFIDKRFYMLTYAAILFEDILYRWTIHNRTIMCI